MAKGRKKITKWVANHEGNREQRIESSATFIKVRRMIDTHCMSNSVFYHNPRRWYAGITLRPAGRKVEHQRNYKKMKHWKVWHVKSAEIASHIEDTLSEEGFINEKGSRGGTSRSMYLYIFKANPTWVE